MEETAAATLGYVGREKVTAIMILIVCRASSVGLIIVGFLEQVSNQPMIVV